MFLTYFDFWTKRDCCPFLKLPWIFDANPNNRSAKPDVLPGGAAKTRFMANM